MNSDYIYTVYIYISMFKFLLSITLRMPSRVKWKASLLASRSPIDSTGTRVASLPNCDLRPAEKTERRQKRYGER